MRSETLGRPRVCHLSRPAGMRSIVLHAKPTLHEHEEGNPDPIGYAGARLACLPLEIRTLPESN